jgi:hypothetical protein
MTVLTSPKLTALLEDRDKLKTKAEQSRATVWRLTQIVQPQSNNATTSIVLDDDSPKFARIGLKISSDAKAVVLTGGIDEQKEAARRKDELERTLRGESLADTTDTKEALAQEHRQWKAYEDGIEHLNREIERERNVLAIQYCGQLKTKHTELMKKMCQPLLAFHAAYSELYALKRHLIDNEVGLRGLCLLTPDFASTPNNPHSELAEFFREAKREGYIKEVPAELRS